MKSLAASFLVIKLLSSSKIQGFHFIPQNPSSYPLPSSSTTKSWRSVAASTDLDGSTLPESSSRDNDVRSSSRLLRSVVSRLWRKPATPVSVIRIDEPRIEPSPPVAAAEAAAAATTNTTRTRTTTVREITTVADLDTYWKEDDMSIKPKELCPTLSVKGDTQIIGSPDHPDLVHPVVKILHDRRRRRRRQQQEQQVGNEDTSDDSDHKKIALVIEGGGMRGCVTAGMVCALKYLGLRDCVDVVYGSSAGSIIGASFVTGQLPWFGPETYYDQLTAAGKDFIDTGRLFRALGLGLLHPRLIKDVVSRRNSGKPVMNLHYLLEETLQNRKRLDWETLVQRQQQHGSKTPTNGQQHQPLKVVASAMKSEKPLVMNYEDGHFTSLEELSQCMHASCLLPGIAGPVVNILTHPTTPDRSTKAATTTKKAKFVLRNGLNDPQYEPLADALIYAPIPYEVAHQEGATHMIVLRSKPDGTDVIGKGGSVGEKLVWSRFFLRKNKLPRIYHRLKQQLHKRLYARNVLELNEAAKTMTISTSSPPSSSSSGLPPTLTVALAPGFQEIARLESNREAIFEGVRQGFARAYDALVEDPNERGNGYEVAQMYFPDEILDYSPNEILKKDPPRGSSLGDPSVSAFERYMEAHGLWPKAWKGLDEAPLEMMYGDESARVSNGQATKQM